MTSHLEQGEIEARCTRLCTDFAWFVDHRDYAAVVDLFAEQGTFERGGEVLRGRDAILRAMHARPVEIDTRHVCTNIRIDTVSPQEATGVAYLLLFRGPAAQPAGAASQPALVAEFHDRYRATPQGWKIVSRIAKAVF